MRRQPIESEALQSVGYDAARRVLEVEFTSGEVYRYFDVPEREHAALVRADSSGAYFVEHVRNAGYRFEHRN